jgi:hypothetical protein
VFWKVAKSDDCGVENQNLKIEVASNKERTMAQVPITTLKFYQIFKSLSDFLESLHYNKKHNQMIPIKIC